MDSSSQGVASLCQSVSQWTNLFRLWYCTFSWRKTVIEFNNASRVMPRITNGKCYDDETCMVYQLTRFVILSSSGLYWTWPTAIKCRYIRTRESVSGSSRLQYWLRVWGYDSITSSNNENSVMTIVMHELVTLVPWAVKRTAVTQWRSCCITERERERAFMLHWMHVCLP